MFPRAGAVIRHPPLRGPHRPGRGAFTVGTGRVRCDLLFILNFLILICCGAPPGDYLLHILSADGSGERALPHLLAPGAWAREPLTSAFAHLKVPVAFIYGAHDWMDVRRVCCVCVCRSLFGFE